MRASCRQARMEKTIYTDEYAILLALLRDTRHAAGMTQVELAQSIQQSQSYVSKIEKGDRRLDVIQLRTICQAMKTTLPDFIDRLEEQLGKKKRHSRE